MALTRFGTMLKQLLSIEELETDKGLAIRNVKFTKKTNFNDKKEQVIISIDYR
ncbi:hypothetical protein PT287_08300 [Lactobacillus sp. ESL0679]|uniref:hypothetical protein n=1 Tax=Lactobacillus sp. ESL0679 TaxID=2983209 RepID=UPI0023F85DC3|nr:hypothetical protein [Lactobacillus sp. ESL0679]MDF7683498.1 hypothetical protein [Lactobacillus sp. ESL0679]